MSEIAKYLRYIIQANKEAKVTAVQAHPVGPLTEFTSQLTEEQPRKGIAAYNNSDAASGDCYYGYNAGISPSGESMPIPLGAFIPIPISTDISVFFCAASGEHGDIRVEELA
uniref:Uncharacterized protein n=1 Tax=viral metagenome TaxID=1070528 RepID=A0A6M3J8Y0_9ZZZZ